MDRLWCSFVFCLPSGKVLFIRTSPGTKVKELSWPTFAFPFIYLPGGNKGPKNEREKDSFIYEWNRTRHRKLIPIIYLFFNLLVGCNGILMSSKSQMGCFKILLKLFNPTLKIKTKFKKLF